MIQDLNVVGQVERDACLHQFPYFRYAVCGYHDFQDFHSQLDRVLNSPSRYKRLMIPRNHLKSSEVMSWILWRILKDPNLSFLYESSVYLQAKKYLGEMRNIIESTEWTARFGDWKGTPWTDSAMTVNRRTVSQPAATVSASGLDKSQTGQHYDIIVLDDLVDELNSRTPEGREKAIQRYKQALSLMRPGGTIVIVGTPWDRDDLYGWIDAQPTIKEMYETVRLDVYDDAGRILFHQKFCETIGEEKVNPGKRSLEFLRLQLGPYQFSCQYRMNPDAEDFSEFKLAWLKHSTIADCQQRLFSNRGKICIFTDPAMGKEHSQHPCDTAIVIAHFMNDQTIDVLEHDIDLIDPGATIDRLHFYAMKYVKTGGVEVYIEDVNFSGVLITQLEKKRNEGGTYYQVHSVRPPGDKDRRIRGLFPFYKFGQVRHSEAIRGGKLEHQLARFPKERLKDGVDAFSQFTYMINFPLKLIEEKINIPYKPSIISMRAPKVADLKKQREPQARSYLIEEGSSDSIFDIG